MSDVSPEEYIRRQDAIGLTEDERKALAYTVHLTNVLAALPQYHADDDREARAKIHEIQRMIMLRPVQRHMYGVTPLAIANKTEEPIQWMSLTQPNQS